MPLLSTPTCVGGSPISLSGNRAGLRWLAGLTLVFLLSACGADISDEPTNGTGQDTTESIDETRVANARFDGEFQVTAIAADGEDVPLQTVATITIETIFGGLTVIPGCNTYFGSYTLAESGQASFTIAGGSSQDCGELDAQEQAVLDALRTVEAWSEAADGFRFDGPGGTSVSISR